MEKYKKERFAQKDVWTNILKYLERSAPELCQVLEFAMIVPNRTVELERKFKVLKAMKSKVRNRLSSNKLKKMFLIHHYFDLADYDEEELMKLFYKNLQKIKNERARRNRERRGRGGHRGARRGAHRGARRGRQ